MQAPLSAVARGSASGDSLLKGRKLLRLEVAGLLAAADGDADTKEGDR